MKTRIYTIMLALLLLSCNQPTTETDAEAATEKVQTQKPDQTEFKGKKGYDAAFLSQDICSIISTAELSKVTGVAAGSIKTESQPGACLYTFTLATGEQARYRIVLLDIERDGAEEILNSFAKDTKEGEELVGDSWHRSRYDGNWYVIRKLRNSLNIYNPAYVVVVSTSFTTDPFIEDEQRREELVEMQEMLADRILERNKN